MKTLKNIIAFPFQLAFVTITVPILFILVKILNDKEKVKEMFIKALNKHTKSKTYNEKELTEFGEYLLSDERRKYFEDAYDEGDEIGLEERLKQVYHRDFEEWKNK